MWILDSEGDFLEGELSLCDLEVAAILMFCALAREACVVAAGEEVSFRSGEARGW